MEWRFGAASADDLVVRITASNAEEAKLILSAVMSQVMKWMPEHGLKQNRTDFLAKRIICSVIPLTVEIEIVKIKTEAKYQGIHTNHN